LDTEKPQEVLNVQEWMICAVEEFDQSTFMSFFQVYNEFCLDDRSFDTSHKEGGNHASECTCPDG